MRKYFTVSMMACLFGIILLATTPVDASQDDTDTNSDEFQILSHNVYMLSKSLYPNWGQNQRAQLIANADYVQNHDLIIFNELFDNEASDILLEGIKQEYPFQTPVLGRSKNGWDETLGNYSHVAFEDGGVSLVSKWPIVEQVQNVYKEGCGVEALSNKGFVYAKVMKQDKAYHVIGTHTQSTDETLCSKEEPASIRALQMKEIQEFIDHKQIPKEDVVFIGGDLNVMKSTSEYSEMIKNLHVSEPDEYKGFNATWDPTTNAIANENYPNLNAQYLDYIFVEKDHAQPSNWTMEAKKIRSPQWTVRSWGKTYEYNEYSDHYPMIGTTKFVDE